MFLCQCIVLLAMHQNVIIISCCSLTDCKQLRNELRNIKNNYEQFDYMWKYAYLNVSHKKWNKNFRLISLSTLKACCSYCWQGRFSISNTYFIKHVSVIVWKCRLYYVAFLASSLISWRLLVCVDFSTLFFGCPMTLWTYWITSVIQNIQRCLITK